MSICFEQPIIDVGTNYYPESLWKMFLINAPAIFRGIWKIVSPWIDPITRKKIFILGGEKDYMPAFQKANIPITSIPTYLGGQHPGIELSQVSK